MFIFFAAGADLKEGESVRITSDKGDDYTVERVGDTLNLKPNNEISKQRMEEYLNNLDG